MNMRRLALSFAAIMTVACCGCHQGPRFKFDHPTKWYEYDFKGGPGIAGLTYEFDNDAIVLRMFAASLQDERLIEGDGHRIGILQKTSDGYEVGSGSTRGRLRFDGEDLILEWEDRDPRKPERRLTSEFPNFQKLREKWESETGMTVEEFLRD